MKKHLLLFVAAFAVGCVAAVAARSAWFKPYVDHSGHPAAPEYSQMVTNPSTPAADSHAGHGAPVSPATAPMETPKTVTAPDDPHAGHDAAMPGKVVNTVCAICGMDVDPEIKPATYKGKLIGFGCRMCPPKFARDPDRYGRAALENKIVSD